VKYLCLCYYDTEKLAQLSQQERDAIGPACKPHDAILRATGKVVVQGSLAPPQAWKTIRRSLARQWSPMVRCWMPHNWLAHSSSLKRTPLMKQRLWHRSTLQQITVSMSAWRLRSERANRSIERVRRHCGS